MYETDKGTIKLKCPKEHEQVNKVTIIGVFIYIYIKKHMYYCAVPEAFSAFKSSKIVQVPMHILFATRSSL